MTTELLRHLEETQFWPAERLRADQDRRLAVLAGHFASESPWFRRRMHAAGARADELRTVDGLQAVPVLGRRDVQAAGEELFTAAIPPGHAPTSDAKTSGSTGEPVVVRRTGVTGLWWLATTLRSYRWWSLDPGARVSVIRAGGLTEYAERATWGVPMSLIGPTGPSQSIPVTTDIEEQVRLLNRFEPGLLLVYPTGLAALIRAGARLPSLHRLLTIGETLSAELRAEATTELGVVVHDTYSSQELGNIAVECTAGSYHAVETVVVEILDDAGRACGPGEIGRVVVTDLTNFATPLIRYDIGDYAEVGGACDCGRGLPTLQRVLGRERNLLHLPDGRRHWPLVGFSRFREVAPVVQYQVVQHDLDDIELRVVAERPLAPQQEAALAGVLVAALGHPFPVRITEHDGRLATGPNGKFEEFVSHL